MDPQHHEDCSAVAKDTTMTAVALYTKARAQSQQSRTETKVLQAIALKPLSDIGADNVVGRMPGPLTGESLDRLNMTLQNEKQPSIFD